MSNSESNVGDDTLSLRLVELPKSIGAFINSSTTTDNHEPSTDDDISFISAAFGDGSPEHIFKSLQSAYQACELTRETEIPRWLSTQEEYNIAIIEQTISDMIEFTIEHYDDELYENEVVSEQFSHHLQYLRSHSRFAGLILDVCRSTIRPDFVVAFRDQDAWNNIEQTAMEVSELQERTANNRDDSTTDTLGAVYLWVCHDKKGSPSMSPSALGDDVEMEDIDGDTSVNPLPKDRLNITAPRFNHLYAGETIKSEPQQDAEESSSFECGRKLQHVTHFENARSRREPALV